MALLVKQLCYIFTHILIDQVLWARMLKIRQIKHLILEDDALVARLLLNNRLNHRFLRKRNLRCIATILNI